MHPTCVVTCRQAGRDTGPARVSFFLDVLSMLRIYGRSEQCKGLHWLAMAVGVFVRVFGCERPIWYLLGYNRIRQNSPLSLLCILWLHFFGLHFLAVLCLASHQIKGWMWSHKILWAACRCLVYAQWKHRIKIWCILCAVEAVTLTKLMRGVRLVYVRLIGLRRNDMKR